MLANFIMKLFGLGQFTVLINVYFYTSEITVTNK